MALTLNAIILTSEYSPKCSANFALPVSFPKSGSPNFLINSLPYNSYNKNKRSTNVINGSLHLEATDTRVSVLPEKKSYKSEELEKSRKHSLDPAAPTVGEMPPEKAEIFKSMEGWARTDLLPLLKPAKNCWQPQDFLPDPTSEGFHDQIREIRARTEQIPDDYFVVLVGDMITEEALPTYQTRFNGNQVFRDETGADQTPWAVWARGWSAEEKRHGDLLNKYLYLSGRVDMKRVETTVQYLIGAGMDIGTEDHPYLWIVYTSFQERATAISHGNTAKLAKQHGDMKLAQICGTIAADEKRHETAYSKIAEKLFELDPNDMVVAFAHMMRRKISMPAHFMYDGFDDNLFQHFSNVASRVGVYTATDYRLILEHSVAKWKVEKLTGLSTDGRQAQDYVCGLPQRIKKLEERARAKAQDRPPVSFSWIFDRQV